MRKRMIQLAAAAALALSLSVGAAAAAHADGGNCMSQLSTATGQVGARDDLARFISGLATTLGVPPGAVDSAVAKTPSCL
jgi:hypothetical protein